MVLLLENQIVYGPSAFRRCIVNPKRSFLLRAVQFVLNSRSMGGDQLWWRQRLLIFPITELRLGHDFMFLKFILIGSLSQKHSL